MNEQELRQALSHDGNVNVLQIKQMLRAILNMIDDSTKTPQVDEDMCACGAHSERWCEDHCKE